VDDQSNEAMRGPISPDRVKKLSAVESVVELGRN
jgi:hypothetical protein